MITRDWLLTETPASAWQARAGRWYRVWLRTARSPAMLFGLAILVLIVLGAVFAPWLAIFAWTVCHALRSAEDCRV